MALVNAKTSSGDRFKVVQAVKQKRRLVVGVAARDKCGKTRFALTAPGPQAIFDFNRSLEGVIEQYPDSLKSILTYKVPKNEPDPQSSAVQLWEQFTGDFRYALDTDEINGEFPIPFKSLIVDLGTEAWELCRLADHGKLEKVQARYYGGTNRAYSELMNAVYDTDKNLILLHRMKKEYSGDSWTGNYELAGYPDTAGLVQINVRMWNWTEEQAEKHDGVPGFHLRVVNCRQNFEAVGVELVNDEITFQNLAMCVFPDSEPSEWE